MRIRRISKRLICTALALAMVMFLLPLQIFTVTSATLNTTADVAEGTSSIYFDYAFTAGQSYKVTATWDSVPVFSGTQMGYTLQTSDKTNPGDLIIKTINETTGMKSSAIHAYSGIFIPARNMTALELSISGITAANKITVTVEPATIEENVLFDGTINLAADTTFSNTFFGLKIAKDSFYDINVAWTSVPQFNVSGTVWKLQPAASVILEGNSAQQFAWIKSTNTDAEKQSYSGIGVQAAMDGDYLNFFTRKLKEANSVHITVKKHVAPGADPTPSALNEQVNVSVGETKYFQYDFKAGKTYQVTATWKDTPSFSGSLSGWQLQTASDLKSTTVGDMVFKAAKQNATNTADVTSYYQGTFTATEDMGVLKLSTTSLLADNAITVQVEEVTLDTGVVYEGIIRLDTDIPWLHTWTGLQLSSEQWYRFTVDYSTAPNYTNDNEEKTAWKLHIPENGNSISGSVIYTNTAASNTAEQNYSEVKMLSAGAEYLSFFTQRTAGSNAVSIKVELAEESEVVYPYEVEDIVIANKILSVPGGVEHCINEGTCTESHPMQAFDIYDGIIFVTYDGGYVMTYDLETGEKVSEFMMGCAISHEHHCGNAMFGTAKYNENDRFPLFYSSGDLSTKACYVERILTDENGKPIGSELVQWINFDMGEYAGANGAQAVIDAENNRIIYQQRKLNSITLVNNAFVIGEYPLPAPTEGTLCNAGYRILNYDVDDFLVPPYELPYWSPMYQGADYYDNQLLQTHGPTTNAFGSNTGLMTFQYNQGSVIFSRYIYLTNIVGNYEPQGVSVYDGKLYISYFSPDGSIYEMTVVLGIDTTGAYVIESAKDNENLSELIAAMVSKQLSDAGKDYTVSEVRITSNADGVFTADVVVKTPYTYQTESISGTVGSHSFTKYISDGNATCETDGTKTAACDHKGCTATNTVTDIGSKLGHSFTKYASDGNATCETDGTKTATCDHNGCAATNTVTDTGSKLGHSFTKYVSDGNATTAADGTKTAICDHSGCMQKHTITDVGSRLPIASDNPDTSDSELFAITACLMLMLMTAVLLLVLLKKRRVN